MKKLTAFLTTAVMLLTLTACRDGSETVKRKKSDKNEGATLEVDMSLAYVSELPHTTTRNISPILQTPEGVLFKNTNSENRVRLTHWNAQTGEFTVVERPNLNMRCTECTAFRMTGDRVGVMFNRENASHWDFNAAAIIEVYDTQMQYTETIEIPAFDGNKRISYAMNTENGTDALVYSYYDYNAENTLKIAAYYLETGEVTDIQGNAYALVSGTSGAVYSTDQSGDNVFIARINIDSGKLEPITLAEGLIWNYTFQYATGSGDYELYLYNGSNVTGVKISGGSGEAEKVMDMDASDLQNKIYDTIDLVASPDSRFAIRDSEDLWICHKRTEEEIESVQAITLAGVNLPADLKNLVVSYNRSHTDYHIFMVDYMDYINDSYYFDSSSFDYLNGGSNTLNGVSSPDDETVAAVELFQQDLVNGIVPDIICTTNLPYAQFANKGLFLDMTELMEKDERFNPDDYLMNFFDSMKYQGQLQTIAFSFYVNTIIGEKEMIGEKQGRTVEEYKTLLQNIPDGMSCFGYSKETYRDDFLMWIQNSFLNTESRICTFDSPAFSSLLEIGNTLLSEEESGYSPESSDYEKNALLTVRSFSQAANYHENYAGEHDRRDITLVGFPTISDNTNGGMFSVPYQLAINAMSAYPEEIWDIFMGMLGEEMQRNYDVETSYRSFPVLRSALKEDLEVVTKTPNRSFLKDGVNKSIGAISMDEQEFLLDYMEHITAFYYADPTVSRIIQEESDKYFAGDQTAQEAADMIQSRASLYISEQY